MYLDVAVCTGFGSTVFIFIVYDVSIYFDHLVPYHEVVQKVEESPTPVTTPVRNQQLDFPTQANPDEAVGLPPSVPATTGSKSAEPNTPMEATPASTPAEPTPTPTKLPGTETKRKVGGCQKPYMDHVYRCML